MANLTLSLDDELLKRCRLYAVQHDTSVNAMVREYLVALADDSAGRERRQRAVARLEELAHEIEREGLIGGDWRWNREEAYAERFSRWNRP